ncbi:anti-sigma factor family protein [Dictyobacter aurantiacus]|uniref:Putative zinc-finger domain-containing protein n=1 Tax=Dictyobacter aurantiacus TaxID=1936993 RepID=A0A401ZLT4_9CHLR|nr:zf-HC2 domain-containing protein [Dictyobacter aurantiacus]GCE07792.1 hypothetical protein KDAU_51210 [Dictyobacter aurantiacus]
MDRWFRKVFAYLVAKKRMANGTLTRRLTCQEVVELVTEYLEGVLAPAKRLQFEQHLAGCPGCANYLEQMRLTIRMIRQITPEPVDPERKADVLRIFRQWKQDEQ